MAANLSDNFSLVLSGGGVFGAAHIGVLRYLEEKELVPEEIIGASIGSLVGAMYAFGFSSGSIFNYTNRIADPKKWMHSSKDNTSLSDFEKIKKIITDYLGNKKMSDAKIPLKIIATDFDTGESVCFSADNDIKVVDAILCSISIPGVFPHIKLKNREYVDGGISSNLPVEFSKHYNSLPDLGLTGKKILAVDVLSEKVWKVQQVHSFFFIGRLRNILTQGSKAVNMLIHNQTQSKVKNMKNLILIKPDLLDVSMFHTKGWEQMVRLGYNEAEKELS